LRILQIICFWIIGEIDQTKSEQAFSSWYIEVVIRALIIFNNLYNDGNLEGERLLSYEICHLE